MAVKNIPAGEYEIRCIQQASKSYQHVLVLDSETNTANRAGMNTGYTWKSLPAIIISTISLIPATFFGVHSKINSEKRVQVLEYEAAFTRDEYIKTQYDEYIYNLRFTESYVIIRNALLVQLDMESTIYKEDSKIQLKVLIHAAVSQQQLLRSSSDILKAIVKEDSTVAQKEFEKQWKQLQHFQQYYHLRAFFVKYGIFPSEEFSPSYGGFEFDMNIIESKALKFFLAEHNLVKFFRSSYSKKILRTRAKLNMDNSGSRDKILRLIIDVMTQRDNEENYFAIITTILMTMEEILSYSRLQYYSSVENLNKGFVSLLSEFISQDVLLSKSHTLVYSDAFNIIRFKNLQRLEVELNYVARFISFAQVMMNALQHDEHGTYKSLDELLKNVEMKNDADSSKVVSGYSVVAATGFTRKDSAPLNSLLKMAETKATGPIYEIKMPTTPTGSYTMKEASSYKVSGNVDNARKVHNYLHNGDFRIAGQYIREKYDTLRDQWAYERIKHDDEQAYIGTWCAFKRPNNFVVLDVRNEEQMKHWSTCPDLTTLVIGFFMRLPQSVQWHIYHEISSSTTTSLLRMMPESTMDENFFERLFVQLSEFLKYGKLGTHSELHQRFSDLRTPSVQDKMSLSMIHYVIVTVQKINTYLARSDSAVTKTKISADVKAFIQLKLRSNSKANWLILMKTVYPLVLDALLSSNVILKLLQDNRDEKTSAASRMRTATESVAVELKESPSSFSSFFTAIKSSPWGIAAAVVTLLLMAVTNLLFFLRSSFTNSYHPLLLEKPTFENSYFLWKLKKISKTNFVLESDLFSQMEMFENKLESSPLEGVELRAENAWNDTFRHLEWVNPTEYQLNKKEYPIVVYLQQVSSGKYLTVDDNGGVYFTSKREARIAFEMIQRN